MTDENAPGVPAASTEPHASVFDDQALRFLVDSVADYGIVMLTPSGHIHSWNRAAALITGYQADEIIGRHFSTFYPAEAIARSWPEFELQSALATGRFEDLGWRVRKDGGLFWADVTIAPIKNEQGKLLGFAKVVRDLTERRQHEERLRQSEERFRLLVEGVRDYAIFMIDPNGKVMSWNAGAQRIKGYTSEEILGQSFTRFYTREDVEAGKPWRTLQSAREQGSVHDESWRIRKDGSLFIAHITVTALYDTSGQLYGFAKVTRDLTREKRIETLEAEGRRISEFLAMLGHELRNPLAPIHSAVKLLELQDISDEKREWCRTVIDHQTSHLTRLVDDLLDITRITRGKIVLRREVLDLATVINRGVEASLPIIQAHRHHLNVVLPEQPIQLEGDLTRLVQVLANLLNNAAKYTPEGGAIDISGSLYRSYAVIRVKDNGIGMPADLLDKAFDLFQQGDRDLDRTQGGLGIGLTLVDGIVSMRGGTIEALSDGIGHGSEFIVRLPLTAPAEARRPTAASATHTAAPRTLRIMVVDDNRDAAETMAMLIDATGHVARAVHDGGSAVAEARRFAPDLVLLDIGLPGMDGYQVARQFKALADLRHIKLVAATGYGQEQDRRRAFEAGFDDFLVKPVSFEKLQGLIDQLHQQTRK